MVNPQKEEVASYAAVRISRRVSTKVKAPYYETQILFEQTVLKMLNCPQEHEAPWLLAPMQPPLHHAHGANNHHGEIGPMIVAARRKEDRGEVITPVTIERGRSIMIILELDVEDRDQGHLIAFV